jgi:hypothetical protein
MNASNSTEGRAGAGRVVFTGSSAVPLVTGVLSAESNRPELAVLTA